MKILNSQQNLDKLFKTITNKKITIITAFASDTENVVDLILNNGNDIEIIVGTINSFTSPGFIDHCSNIKNKSLSMFVDFRYQNSIHWKLYLIEPNTVIIGSANFTSIGMSLFRDTCVMIESDDLYHSYENQISILKNSNNIINKNNTSIFSKELEKYRVSHQRMQAGLARAKQYKNSNEWLLDESNQSIPLFIWESRHSKEEIENSHEIFESKFESNEENLSRSDIRTFFTYQCNENELPYEQGDVVLCSNSKGTHIGFYEFDQIIYKNGTHYIYSYRKRSYKNPFKLVDIKNELKLKITELYNKGYTELHRAVIIDICKNTNMAFNQ